MKHRERKQMRIPGYDYSSEGDYFITICTKNRINYFGEIQNAKMRLNKYGNIINEQWIWLKKQYKYINLDEYMVMPNHFHGILTIEYGIDHVRVGRDRPQQIKIKPISELIGAFKTRSSKFIHLTGNSDFQWQRSFWDHIIQTNKDYENIREYIRKNPENWVGDRNNIL